ncbi:MAG: hypothetical protein H8E79_03635 [Desulfobulbaceae bacterium]|uniref:Uncharacterized protein n=1 Tax=Candidatus Desulfatifera sulfidica TaxID=2841691 RepID=A0A8J6N9Z1_9BACT|nr:hypothetical protein [Candidatus Desulfatifera sulfidica]
MLQNKKRAARINFNPERLFYTSFLNTPDRPPPENQLKMAEHARTDCNQA